jgi:hypothetical protein
MSRSYRRPYAAVTGLASAKNDKRLANRGVRRKQKSTLKTCPDYENLLVPHRLECASNNTYAWSRDGAQCYLGYLHNSSLDYDQKYYQRLLRK